MSEAANPSPDRLVFVTGLSGSGRSTVAKCFEDLGYYCVDNLPMPLLRQLVASPQSFVAGRHRIVIVADVRTPGFASEAPRLFESIDRGRLRPTIVFLEASDDSLLRRFSESRRPHPFSDSLPVPECIRQEREMLRELRGAADLVLDTSDWSVHDIRSLIYREFGQDAGHQPAMMVTLVSFGFKFGLPHGSDLVIDVRFLPNPHFVPELRPFTGKDPAVRQFLEQRTEFQDFVGRFSDLLRYLLPRYQQENRSYLTIAVGCTGGQHRSVAVVEALESGLAEAGWGVRVQHRELERVRQ